VSTLKIEERFELDAHPDEAWAYLTHPERIVVCLPGAELTEVIDERHYAGGVKVKLGAIAMQYQGTIEFTELDHERRFIRMEGKGRERRGGGNVSLAMESTVHELEGDRCEIRIVADIQLAGKIVSFGRGMIQAVTAEVFKEFTARLAAELAANQSEGHAGETGVAEEASSPKALALFPILLRSFRTWLRRLFGRG
jgi:carbon monoxide dehydrogenase subunit G